MVQLQQSNELEHSGVLGMKWGHRKVKSVKAPEDKQHSKEVQKALKDAKRREAILKDPAKLYRHRKEFSDAEIEAAIKKLNMDRTLRSLSNDKMKTGLNYANTALSYAEAGVKGYETYKKISGHVKARKR